MGDGGALKVAFTFIGIEERKCFFEKDTFLSLQYNFWFPLLAPVGQVCVGNRMCMQRTFAHTQVTDSIGTCGTSACGYASMQRTLAHMQVKDSIDDVTWDAAQKKLACVSATLSHSLFVPHWPTDYDSQVKGSIDDIMWDAVQKKLSCVGKVLDGRQDAMQVRVCVCLRNEGCGVCV